MRTLTLRTFTSILLLAAAPHLFGAGFTAKGAFLALSVADLESSATWYRDKLGLEVVDRPATGDVKVAILEGGGLIVELIQHKDAKVRGGTDAYLHHGIFKSGVIVDDFDGLVAMLREKKADIAYGPFPARGKQRANLIVRDNAGNLIQFFAAR
jgi:catechol-2,3-dioxygenase